MKTIYTHEIILSLNIDGNWQVIPNQSLSRSYYQYGELPHDYEENYMDEDTVFEQLAKRLGYVNSNGVRQPFTRRRYIDLFPLATGFVYKDKLKAAKIEHKHVIPQKPDIELLKKDLGFYIYSELVFNREQELKKMMREERENK